MHRPVTEVSRNTADVTDAARLLYERGANVALLRPGTRTPWHPWRRWGAAQERQTVADLELLLKRYGSGSDLAILLGLGLVALDVDSDAFATRVRDYDTVAEWMDRTARVRTGSGKLHCFGTYPVEGAAPRTWRAHEEDVHGELLAAGALVVAPPSRHYRTGEQYRWEVSLGRALPLPEVLWSCPWRPASRGASDPNLTADDVGTPIKAPSIDRGRKTHYFDIAMQGIRTDLGALTDGRKNRLHDRSFHVGANVACSAYELRRARRTLLAACNDNGLVDDAGADYCIDVITRGLRAGYRRALSERELIGTG